MHHSKRSPRGQFHLFYPLGFGDTPGMAFNKRKLEDRRRQAAEKEAAARRATELQILEDADHHITVERAARPATPSATSTCARSIGAAARPYIFTVIELARMELAQHCQR